MAGDSGIEVVDLVSGVGLFPQKRVERGITVKPMPLNGKQAFQIV